MTKRSVSGFGTGFLGFLIVVLALSWLMMGAMVAWPLMRLIGSWF